MIDKLKNILLCPKAKTPLVYKKKFPFKNSPWQNQALQREFILKNLDYLNDEDYIFFSDPDEIPNPEILINFELKKKYGIFMQKCFNYKFKRHCN